MRAFARGLVLLCLALFPAIGTTVALAETFHVPGDFPTIQEALDFVPPGSLILVAPGTYSGPLNTNLDFHGKDVELRSTGGAAVTIIDCSSGPGAARGFLFDDAETAAAIVDGLTIRRGWAPDAPVAMGGSILCTNGSSPTIRNCVFEENWALEPSGGGGGAIACLEGSSPAIAQCTFTMNESFRGAGLYMSASSPAVTDCRFTANGAPGGGGNGAGILCAAASAPEITGCEFTANDSGAGAFGGGIYSEGSTPTVTGCTFVENFGYRGAGVMCTGASATIVRSTFVGQTALYDERSAVGAYEDFNGHPSQVEVENSIIAFGEGVAVSCDAASSVTMSCCDVFGNAGGDWAGCIAGQGGTSGNLSADPLFCDLPGRDFTLHDDSPCAPPQSGACGLIGAWAVACGPSPVEPVSWGAVKRRSSRVRRGARRWRFRPSPRAPLPYTRTPTL